MIVNSMQKSFLCNNMNYCIKSCVTRYYSHILTGTNLCINKAIHKLLMHGLKTLRILGSSQKLTSLTLTCIEVGITQ